MVPKTARIWHSSTGRGRGTEGALVRPSSLVFSSLCGMSVQTDKACFSFTADRWTQSSYERWKFRDDDDDGSSFPLAEVEEDLSEEAFERAREQRDSKVNLDKALYIQSDLANLVELTLLLVLFVRVGPEQSTGQ